MDPRDKRQNLANLIERIENESGFKEQLLQEFLNAETDKEIKIKYDLSDYAIKTIRREYGWGELIKTARFSRNWAKEHPQEEKPEPRNKAPLKKDNLKNLMAKADEDETFRLELYQQFIDLTDQEILDLYNLSVDALTIIRKHFGWSYSIMSARTKKHFREKYGTEKPTRENGRIISKPYYAVEADIRYEKFVEELDSNPELLAQFSEDVLCSLTKDYKNIREKYNLRKVDLANLKKKYNLYIDEEERQKRIVNKACESLGIDNIGYTNISQIPEIREKIDSTLQSRTEEEQALINKKTNETCQERYGGRFNASPSIKAKYEKTMLDKYGVPHNWASKDPELNGQATMMKEYGVANASQIPHIAAKKSKRYKTEDGTGLDSAWELEVYNFFTRNGIEIERNIPIKYEYKGVKHTTFIDFKIDDILLEVKGGHLLNGLFSDRLPVPIDEKIKIYKENHVIVITDKSARQLFGKKDSSESAGLKYPNKCPNPLIGVDIDLFLNPQFPYRADRPKCFYEVSVNGKPSQIEAFNDEKLRWQMIKNRINYVGGFIDSKEILYALNVTRRSKQPSWFSKNFAKEIINTHITSDIIVDPFAGWGARNDASIELGKQYIGIDYNKDLVDWHRSMGRNIEFGDANLFTYDSDCSVFICPPYTDIEVYFEGQDLETTQCEWLKIVMENIPNAREYVMVCKVVDRGWEKYIVETKTNKSHFGSNNEYIIKLTQEEKNKLFNE